MNAIWKNLQKQMSYYLKLCKPAELKDKSENSEF